MLLCKNRRLFTVAGDKFVRRFSNSHVLTPIPMHFISIPILWMILLSFPWKSHGTHGIPVFPIPMHTSTARPGAEQQRAAWRSAANASNATSTADVRELANQSISRMKLNTYLLLSSVFTCIGALGTPPNRTGPVARKYLPGFC